MTEYEKGMCAGHTAFLIGGKKLYSETPEGIKELGFYNNKYDLTVPDDMIKYARGYIYGYDTIKNHYLNRI